MQNKPSKRLQKVHYIAYYIIFKIKIKEMRIKTSEQNKLHYYLQKLESNIQQYLWKENKARKGYSIVVTHSLE